jgi:hypothetical protein
MTTHRKESTYMCPNPTTGSITGELMDINFYCHISNFMDMFHTLKRNNILEHGPKFYLFNLNLEMASILSVQRKHLLPLGTVKHILGFSSNAFIYINFKMRK